MGPAHGQGVGFPRALAVFSLAATLAVVGGCVGHRSPDFRPPGSQAYPEALLTPSGAPVSRQAFATGPARADYILIGEEHPNPCDHLAQAGVIRRLVADGLRPVIGLEMVPADFQTILDAFNAGKLAVADLPGALDWRHTWGFDFDLYAAIFEVAREFDLPVFALNAPKGLARKVGRIGLGALTPSERATLPGTILPPDAAQVEELRDLFNAHAAMRQKAAKAADGRDPFADFLTVQALWDTQMAARAELAHARTGRPVVIIAGGGHVQRNWGIARRLARLDPGARIATVMPWRGGELPDPEEAQLFFACPAIQKSRLGLTLSSEPPAPGQPAMPLLVTAVAPDSAAAKAGLLAGDAITAVGEHPATDLSVLHTAAIAALMAGHPLRLTISRAGETLTIDIPLGPPPAAN